MTTQTQETEKDWPSCFTADTSAYKDDNVHTRSSIEQRGCMNKVALCYDRYSENPELFYNVELHRERHKLYLLKGLNQLGEGYQGLDASRPWLCYWILHALDLLDAVPIPQTTKTYQFLARCQHPEGGFCGGPGQIPHLAPNYAAVNALVICDDIEAYKLVDRQKMYNFLMRMKTSSGAFTMHPDGEIDVRGSYCALSAASILNIMTPELTEGVAEFIVSCQTYEGGMGDRPGTEAHGGYTFCALAAMMILGKAHMLDLNRLLAWVVQRQMDFEGGFQGRTNKLVDSCYSFWQGAIFPLVQYALGSVPSYDTEDPSNSENQDDNSWLFDQLALQKYILVACQDDGGLKDKPGKGRDYYHTCYALSGLAVAQHNELDANVQNINIEMPTHICVVGKFQNLVEIIHPVYNLRPERLARAIAYFRTLEQPTL